MEQKLTPFSKEEIEAETDRLFASLGKLGWTREDCEIIAPLTLEINQLKKEKNAIILAHSYQRPQIVFGIADFVGDSYGLSKAAMEADAETIIFCGVKFMAETAKILNPDKKVILPNLEAGCSLADSITAEDVLRLKEQYPGVPVVCYVNTSAEVKAVCDVCVTSSNAEKIVNNLPGDTVIFIPDYHMGRNLAESTGKKIILWNGKCIVHDEFTEQHVEEVRQLYPDVTIMAHAECDPSVVSLVDLVAGTQGMINYIKEHGKGTYMLVTECGLADRLQVEFPESKFVGTCMLCPYMKKITLKNTLDALKNPSPEQIIDLDPETIEKARHSLEQMFVVEKGPVSTF